MTNFKGFQSPNFTQIPNEYLDYTFSPECDLSKIQMQIMNFVFRETFGWQDKHKIMIFSVTDIMALLNVKNRNQVVNALNELVEEKNFLGSIEVSKLSKKVRSNIEKSIGKTLQPKQKIYRLNLVEGKKRRWDNAEEPHTDLHKRKVIFKGSFKNDTTSDIKNDTTSDIKNDTTSDIKNDTTSEAETVEAVESNPSLNKVLNKDLNKDLNKVCVEEDRILELIRSREDLYTHTHKLISILNKKKKHTSFKYDVFLKTLQIIDVDIKGISYLETALMNNLKKGFVNDFSDQPVKEKKVNETDRRFTKINDLRKTANLALDELIELRSTLANELDIKEIDRLIDSKRRNEMDLENKTDDQLKKMIEFYQQNPSKYEEELKMVEYNLHLRRKNNEIQDMLAQLSSAKAVN